MLDVNIPNVFLPHTMANYETADRQIFYLGRDTNGWGNLSHLFQTYKDNLWEYPADSSDCLRGFGFLDYNKNNPYGFWTLVCRLHLRLKGIEETVPISKNLDQKFKHLLSDFGWGNIHSIETKKSLEKRDIWRQLDTQKYNFTKERSKILDKLKHILEVFNPELIFIFNWDAEEEPYLEGLQIIESEGVDGSGFRIAKYRFEGYRTTLYWTDHPGSIKFKSRRLENFISVLISRV